MQGGGSIHVRHHVIHENDMVSVFGGPLQRGFAAVRRIHLHFGITQQFHHYHQVHGIVIHHQNAGIRRDKTLTVGGTPVQLLLHGKVYDADGADIDDALLQFDGKDRAFVINAVHGNFAAHHFHQMFGDGETKPGALDIAVIRFVHPLEGVEEIVKAFLADAHTCIFHRDSQKNLVCGNPLSFGG